MIGYFAIRLTDLPCSQYIKLPQIKVKYCDTSLEKNELYIYNCLVVSI